MPTGTAEPVLLDTCAVIWLMSAAPMSAGSRQVIQVATNGAAGVYVSPMTAWEIGLLSAKGRLTLSMGPVDWFQALLALPHVRLAALAPDVLIESSYLPECPLEDPVDRILVATARASGFLLITRDRVILRYAASGRVKAVGC